MKLEPVVIRASRLHYFIILTSLAILICAVAYLLWPFIWNVVSGPI